MGVILSFEGKNMFRSFKLQILESFLIKKHVYIYDVYIHILHATYLNC